jgi:hypothetical protein
MIARANPVFAIRPRDGEDMPLLLVQLHIAREEAFAVLERLDGVRRPTTT